MQFVGAFSKIFFFSKAKLIWWHHHYPWYYSENTILILTKRYLEKFIIKFIDELVANSEYLRLSLETLYKRKSKILYPTIILPSTNSFSSNKDKESKIIFTYARWVKGKNVEQIFETYEYLK